jgi:hypothetical protein
MDLKILSSTTPPMSATTSNITQALFRATSSSSEAPIGLSSVANAGADGQAAPLHGLLPRPGQHWPQIGHERLAAGAALTHGVLGALAMLR